MVQYSGTWVFALVQVLTAFASTIAATAALQAVASSAKGLRRQARAGREEGERAEEFARRASALSVAVSLELFGLSVSRALRNIDVNFDVSLLAFQPFPVDVRWSLLEPSIAAEAVVYPVQAMHWVGIATDHPSAEGRDLTAAANILQALQKDAFLIAARVRREHWLPAFDCGRLPQGWESEQPSE